MYFLKRPELNIPTADIFRDCVAGYTSDDAAKEAEFQDKRQRLSKCEDAVRADSSDYEKKVLDGTFCPTPLPADVGSKELANVYKDMFAKSGKPGRTLYELIQGLADCGECPICGKRLDDPQLDHYLPKSHFPTLCVEPQNLIPICAACNKAKGTSYSLKKNKRILHMYFDRLPVTVDRWNGEIQEIFLHAKINPDFTVTFYVKCPDSWPADLRSRVGNHVKVYKLLDRYRNDVKKQTTALCYTWKRKVREWPGAQAMKPQEIRALEKRILRTVLEERVRYVERDPNSVESALARGLLAQLDDTYLWFQSIG